MARLSDQEIKRRYEEQLAIFRGSISDDEAAELWPECSITERNRRRKLKETQQARYHTIVDDDEGTRMMGGKQVSAANSGKQIMEAIAHAANGPRQKEVMDSLFAPLSDSSPAVRGKGAERIVKIAAEQLEVERKDRDELRKLGKDELIDRLAKAILESGTAATLFEELAKGNAPKAAITVKAQDVDVSRAA